MPFLTLRTYQQRASFPQRINGTLWLPLLRHEAATTCANIGQSFRRRLSSTRSYRQARKRRRPRRQCSQSRLERSCGTSTETTRFGMGSAGGHDMLTRRAGRQQRDVSTFRYNFDRRDECTSGWRKLARYWLFAKPAVQLVRLRLCYERTDADDLGLRADQAYRRPARSARNNAETVDQTCRPR